MTALNVHERQPEETNRSEAMANTIKVSVGRVPGKIVEIDIAPGTNVREALNFAGIDGEQHGYSLTVNNREANLDDEIREPSSVLMTQRIRGN